MRVRFFVACARLFREHGLIVDTAWGAKYAHANKYLT
jgi:hypothetical protein